MDRNNAISLIKGIEPRVRQHGVTALYLFGSTARGEATTSSDIDIFIDHDRSRKFGLFELFDVEHLLEETLGAKVDICTHASLHPILRADIERSAIRII
jgi:predicted nucleotidyltransferase